MNGEGGRGAGLLGVTASWWTVVWTADLVLHTRTTSCRYVKTGGTDKCFSGSGGGHASGSQIELRQISGLW